MTAVVAIAAVFLVVRFSEIMQQYLAPTHRRLGVVGRLEQQLMAYLLFLHGFCLHQFVELLQIFAAVERNAVSQTPVAARTTRLLIISLEALGNVVMDHEPHVGLVDAHSERYRGYDHVDALLQKRVLVGRTLRRVHSGVIGQGCYAVDVQRLGKLLHFFAAQAVYDARFSGMLTDVADYLFVDILGLRSHFVIKVLAVEARFIDLGVQNAEIFLDVVLHLQRGRGGQRYHREISYLRYHGSDLAVFGAEIVAPFRDAMGLVDSEKRYVDRFQELDVLLLAQRFGRYIKQLGASLAHIGAHLLGIALRQRRIQKVGYAVAVYISADRIHLILHQRDQRRDYYRRSFEHQRRQLITQ